MNHPTHKFRPFQGDSTICIICGKTNEDHDKITLCEVCNTPGPVLKYQPKNAAAPILYCKECLETEHKSEDLARYNEMTPDERVEHSQNDWKNRVVKEVEKVLEQEVVIRTDVFNAEIPSILSLRASVESDESIPVEKRNEAIALALKTQWEQLQAVIFELNSARDIATSRQKSIQQYLNDFVKKLTVEEREKISVKDLTYQPKTAKVPSPKKISVKSPKFDREAIAQVIKEFPFLTISGVQASCISMNMTPPQFAEFIRKQTA